MGAIIAARSPMNGDRDDVHTFVRDIGVRGALLGLGGLIVTGSVAALTLKAARRPAKLALGATVLMVSGAVAAWEVREMQQHP
jgi:hypothetical protein